eukprot:jgi/Mesvir1/13048/Mv06036-RA.1
MASKRSSAQRSLAAALSPENTSAPAAALPHGPEGSGATSQALVVAQPPPELASPAASPEPKRSRPAEPNLDEYDFDASQPGFFDKLTHDRILAYVFFGSHASLYKEMHASSFSTKVASSMPSFRGAISTRTSSTPAAPTFSNSHFSPSLDAPSRSSGPPSPSPPP